MRRKEQEEERRKEAKEGMKMKENEKINESDTSNFGLHFRGFQHKVPTFRFFS